MSAQKKRKFTDQDSDDDIIGFLRLIYEQTQQTNEYLRSIDYRIHRIESHIERLTKEVSDLQIHALHGFNGGFHGSAEETPYVHY